MKPNIASSIDDSDITPPTSSSIPHLRRRYESALRVMRYQQMHEARFAAIKLRIPTPAQRAARAEAERRITKPYVDIVEEREQTRLRDENIARTQIFLRTLLRPKGA